MRKTNFHLFHVSFLNLLFDGLEYSGVNTDQIIEQSSIRKFDLNNPSTYLPQSVYYEFIENVKRKERVDIAGEFYHNFRISCDLSDFGKFVSKSENLYSMILNGIKYNYQVQTNGKLKLEIDGPIATFSMNHIDIPREGRIISEKIELSMMLKSLQQVLGITWIPQEIHLTSDSGDWLKKHLHSFDLNIKTNCERMALVFPTDLLAIKNPYYSESNSIQDKNFNSNVVLMNKTIGSLKMGHIPTVNELAGYFNCSKKTIFREFNKSGHSYFSLLKSHLFAKSLDLLKDKSLSVHDISDILGYDNTSNFIRAFKSWTGTTPYQYRKMNFS